MSYPLTLISLAIISLAVQATLWLGYLVFIPVLDRTALLWIACAGAAAAACFLVVYRFFATDMKAWNLPFLLCTVLQFASLGNSLYFAWLILTGI